MPKIPPAPPAAAPPPNTPPPPEKEPWGAVPSSGTPTMLSYKIDSKYMFFDKKYKY